jgi:hypothetical protein
MIAVWGWNNCSYTMLMLTKQVVLDGILYIEILYQHNGMESKNFSIKLQAMIKMSPTCLHTFIDTPNCVFEERVQYSTVRIPNVFCDGYLHITNCVGIVRINRDFLITLYMCTCFWLPCICVHAFDYPVYVYVLLVNLYWEDYPFFPCINDYPSFPFSKWGWKRYMAAISCIIILLKFKHKTAKGCLKHRGRWSSSNSSSRKPR